MEYQPQQLTKQQGGFGHGERRRLIEAPGTPLFLPLICYEIIYGGQIVPSDTAARPQWIVNLTNDAWFGQTSGPYQHAHQSQVRAVEDLIAQGVDAIGVVPNDAEVLEPVLARARAQGIKVITHESPRQKNIDWNFEMVSAAGFGIAHAELPAQKMGGEGKYAMYVGSLTVPLHNAWADAAVEYLGKKYPGMELVADRFGVAESSSD